MSDFAEVFVNKRYLVLTGLVLALAPFALAATVQQTATVERQGEVFTCHSVLTEIPSHRVLADQTTTTKIGEEGQALSSSKTADGSWVEYHMSCTVGDKGETAVVTVKSSHSKNGVVSVLSTSTAQVKVSQPK